MLRRDQHAHGGLQADAAPEQITGDPLLVDAPLRGLRIPNVLSGEGVGSAVHDASISAMAPRYRDAAHAARAQRRMMTMGAAAGGSAFPVDTSMDTARLNTSTMHPGAGRLVLTAALEQR